MGSARSVIYGMSASDDDYGRPLWQAFAACHGVDTSIFFPERGQQKKVQVAKRICSGCPVRGECLDYALNELPSEQERVGIWGGTTCDERRSIRRHRNATAKKTDDAA